MPEEKYTIFGDDPEEFAKLLDPDKDGRPGFTHKKGLLKLINRIPKELQKVPPPEFEQDILKMITGYGVWYLTHYGAHLIGLVCGVCGTIFGQVVKLRTGIKQERIPFL